MKREKERERDRERKKTNWWKWMNMIDDSSLTPLSLTSLHDIFYYFLSTCQKRHFHQSNFLLFFWGGGKGGIICVSKLTWLWHDRRRGENCLSPLWRRFALPRTFECWYPLLNCIKKTGKRGGEEKKKKRKWIRSSF